MKLLICILLFFQIDTSSAAVKLSQDIPAFSIASLADTTHQHFDHEDIIEANKLRWNVFRSYFYHLAKTPDEITAIIKWTMCTFMLWFMLYKYRERAIAGMANSNLFWEGGEQVTYYTFYAFFPILFHVSFFPVVNQIALWGLGITAGIMVYQVTGRYIFDWALAIRTGSKIVETKEEVKVEHTQTQTETK